jgi:hypothetical protein
MSEPRGDSNMTLSHTPTQAVRPTGNLFPDLCCDGAEHPGYAAPAGQSGYPGADPILTQPHAHCHVFSAYILRP